MDANKRTELENIGYKIRQTCNICTHGQFATGQVFGTCGKHEYTHLKHTGQARSLSIAKSGYCPSFELDDLELCILHKYAEFLED